MTLRTLFLTKGFIYFFADVDIHDPHTQVQKSSGANPLFPGHQTKAASLSSKPSKLWKPTRRIPLKVRLML